MALTGEELCVSIICESRQMILSSTLRHSLFSPRKFGGDIFFFFFLLHGAKHFCRSRHRAASPALGAIWVDTFSISFYCLDFRRFRMAPYGYTPSLSVSTVSIFVASAWRNMGTHLLYQFLLSRFSSTPLGAIWGTPSLSISTVSISVDSAASHRAAIWIHPFTP